MCLGELCVGPVLTIDEGESLVTAARLLGRYSQDTLVVTRMGGGGEEAVGMLRERDILLRAVALPVANLAETRVGELLRSERCILPSATSLKEAIGLMGRAGIRRGVVVDGAGRPLGITTLDAVLSALMVRRRQREGLTYTQDDLRRSNKLSA